jgi:hypothetical protein
MPVSRLTATKYLDRLTDRGLSRSTSSDGLRGGLAIAMAMSLPDSPEKPVILHTHDLRRRRLLDTR